MKLYLSLLIWLCCATVWAADFSVFVTRHAEKRIDQGKDPELTACGDIRANNLATLLQHIHIDTIYSTHYRRTQGTVAPTAKQKNLQINEYSPMPAEAFANSLRKLQKNALVAGHSNTVAPLINALTQGNQSDLSESDYGKLWQINFVGNRASVTLWQIPMPTSCQ